MNDIAGAGTASVTGIGGLPNWKYMVKAVAWLGPWQPKIIQSFHHHTLVTEPLGIRKFHHSYYYEGGGEEVTCDVHYRQFLRYTWQAVPLVPGVVMNNPLAQQLRVGGEWVESRPH